MATNYGGGVGIEPAVPKSKVVGQAGDEDNIEKPLSTKLCTGVLIFCSVILIILFFPFSLFYMIKVIPEYQRAVIFRLGRVEEGDAKGPGLFWIIPCIDSLRAVDLRTVSFDVAPQEILSKDSVAVQVDAVVYYRIFDPKISVTNIKDAPKATKLLAQTTLRNVLGAHTLAEMLSERESISDQMQQALDLATDPWGVKVERVEIKDVRLPANLQRAMAAEAEATREAKAKIIASQGELNASRALKEAAVVIAASPTALQLRYLQTLSIIAAERSSSIFFPIPIDIMSGMGDMGGPKEPGSVI
ncbi:stomatin-4-like [Dysidea avara]|uniref:stomatin-4-like n=1 Tax=Dysidea avara TaxID=196820 RepID=UPI0033349519